MKVQGLAPDTNFVSKLVIKLYNNAVLVNLINIKYELMQEYYFVCLNSQTISQKVILKYVLIYHKDRSQLATDFGSSGSFFAKCKAVLQVQRHSALRKENQL